MSLQSPCELVKPHATCVLLPTTTEGTPGSVTPIRRWGDVLGPSCHSSDARYHVFGTRTVRCMSLARSARPSPVRRPETAQLLLPMDPSLSIPNSQLPTPNCPLPAPNRRSINPSDPLASCSIGRTTGVESFDSSCLGG